MPIIDFSAKLPLSPYSMGFFRKSYYVIFDHVNTEFRTVEAALAANPTITAKFSFSRPEAPYKKRLLSLHSSMSRQLHHYQAPAFMRLRACLRKRIRKQALLFAR